MDLIDLALYEDLGLPKGGSWSAGDVTSGAFIPTGSVSYARILAREACVVSGLSIATEVFRRVDPLLQVLHRCADGEHLTEGAVLLEVTGATRSILSAERTALNFLGRLCGIASLAARYSEEVRGFRVEILDTRKTTPGWRLLEKQAVVAGGCTNHRMGLHDAVLVKDNHLAALGDISLLQPVIAGLRGEHPDLSIEIEADTLEQVGALLELRGIDVVLLDNMSLVSLRQAVAMRDASAPGVLLEASGGITLENVRETASTGVDRISVGALTHSAVNADLSLEHVA